MSSIPTRQRTEDTADVIFVFVGLCIISLNITEIRLISRIRYKKMFDKLLLSLATSDVIVGVSVAVYKFLDLSLGRNGLKWSEEGTFAHLFLFSLTFSLFNLIAISIDRYLAVRFPIKHRMMLTASRSNMTILFIWVISLVPITLDVMMVVFLEGFSNYFLLSSSVVAFVFGVFLVTSYASIIYFIYKRRTKFSNESHHRRTRWKMLVSIFSKPGTTERNVFISSCFVTSSFIISTYPFAIEYLVLGSGNEISFTSKFLILLNSLLNPFTYFFKNYLCSKYSKVSTKDAELANMKQL